MITRQLFTAQTWRRLHPVAGVALISCHCRALACAGHLRNPPYFDFTMHSERGSYHGFFWFYFINEHLLRYLGRRYPRDYNTVPRLYFWLLHLVWLFPWSVYLPAVCETRFQSAGPRRPHASAGAVLDRFRSAVLFVLDHAGILFDAMLPGAGIIDRLRSGVGQPALAPWHAGRRHHRDALLRRDRRILWLVRSTPAPGDISVALNQKPDIYTAYTLSLGHMGDLTLASVRLPAAAAGARGPRAFDRRSRRMEVPRPPRRAATRDDDGSVLPRRAPGARDFRSVHGIAPAGRSPQPFARRPSHRRRSVLRVFLGHVLCQSPRAAVEWPLRQYRVRLVRARRARCFLDDAQFARLWSQPERYYLVAAGPAVARFEKLVGKPSLHVVARKRREVSVHKPLKADSCRTAEGYFPKT